MRNNMKILDSDLQKSENSATSEVFEFEAMITFDVKILVDSNTFDDHYRHFEKLLRATNLSDYEVEKLCAKQRASSPRNEETAAHIAMRVASAISNLPVTCYDEESDKCFTKIPELNTFISNLSVTPGKYVPEIKVYLKKSNDEYLQTYPSKFND